MQVRSNWNNYSAGPQSLAKKKPHNRVRRLGVLICRKMQPSHHLQLNGGSVVKFYCFGMAGRMWGRGWGNNSLALFLLKSVPMPELTGESKNQHRLALRLVSSSKQIWTFFGAW